MTGQIILYDIDNEEHICWSPNTFKPRAVLALKKVDYTTEWISYPDLDATLRAHGQESAETVTAPVLQDGETYVADSWQIAKYLEEKYPTPTVFPRGVEAHEHFHDYCKKNLQMNILRWILPQVPPILDSRGTEYFKRTREANFDMTLEQVAQGGDDEFLPRLRGGMTPIFHALRTSGKFIMGDEFGYADCTVLSLCQWIKRCDAAKFEKFLALDSDGNFKHWYSRCEPYMQKMS